MKPTTLKTEPLPLTELRKVVVGGSRNRLLLLLAAMLCTAAARADTSASAPARKPNIVLILIDDLGYGDIEPFGCTNCVTPALDRMANEGMKFTSFYAAPVCSASRAQIQTGCYAPRVSLPGVLGPNSPVGLNPEEHTVAKLLKAQGYATMCIGKWHLGDQPEFFPTHFGFDHYYGLPYSNDMIRKNSDTGKDVVPLMRDNKVVSLWTEDDQDQMTRLYTEEAVEFIKANREHPFYLYLAHNAVHCPIHPGPEFRGKSGHGRYYDWVEEIDWSAGRVLDTLRELNLATNTLVIFTSDNGPWLVKGKDAGSAGPLRGGKGSTWEGGLRESTLAWWPGHVPAGRVTDAVAGEIDLLPTFVQAFAAASQKPNIIFVLFDDMGYGQPKCYRAGSEFNTPNLDRLAREGMRFTDAHSAASVCTPTRYGVLTGRYPSRIGQYGVLTTYSKPIIPKTRLTVAALLKQSGYDTACIGKWHLGMDWGGKPGNEKSVPVGTRLLTSPNAAGFDYFYGYTHARNIGTVIEQNKVEANVEEVETQPRLAKKVIAFLDNPARKEKPFFLYLPLCPPHTPIVPAPEFVGKSGVNGREHDYGDWLYQGDWVLGQVLESLERNKLADDTLILVSSDNGAAGRSYAPLRGAKTSIYEGGHREPFVARWPGKIKAGSVCDDTICLNDLMATCAEIVGAKLPDNAGEDSVSILPDLLGAAKGPVREATLHQSPRGDLAIRQGPWKLIFLNNGNRELYNLQTDLSEKQNVAGANPDVVGCLTALMQKYIADGRSTVGAAQKNDVPMSLEGSGGGKKGKKSKKRGAKEVALALNPDFD